MLQETRQGGKRSFDPVVPDEFLLLMLRLWHMPIIVGTAWWNAMVDLCWPRPPAGHHETCHEAHDQFVVPDPIEAEGEHALFA